MRRRWETVEYDGHANPLLKSYPIGSGPIVKWRVKVSITAPEPAMGDPNQRSWSGN